MRPLRKKSFPKKLTFRVIFSLWITELIQSAWPLYLSRLFFQSSFVIDVFSFEFDVRFAIVPSAINCQRPWRVDRSLLMVPTPSLFNSTCTQVLLSWNQKELAHFLGSTAVHMFTNNLEPLTMTLRNNQVSHHSRNVRASLITMQCCFYCKFYVLFSPICHIFYHHFAIF